MYKKILWKIICFCNENLLKSNLKRIILTLIIENDIYIVNKTALNLTLCTISVLGTFASCYFPAAFQGEFVTQAIMSAVPTISYSKLTVQFDSIPIWGVCHRRIGNNVILVDEIPDGGDSAGTRCFKCFNLVLRSSNVLQIHTSGLDKVM